MNALYPWLDDEENGAECVHPDDLDRFRAFVPYGRVFEVEFLDEQYVCLRYGAAFFRVTPHLLKEVLDLQFRIGDRVKPEGREDVGEIIEAMWHYKVSMPFYFISINGRKSSKRYWDIELIPAD